MKKTAIIVCMILLVLQTFPIFGAVKEAHAAMTGDGSADNPYIIMTPQDLSDIRNNLSVNYKLGADIDLGSYDAGDGRGWLPIGDTGTGGFNGTLDGNGYAIRNLKIERSSMRNVGLFGEMTGTLTNIQLLEVSIHGSQYVGALAGAVLPPGRITNSYVTSYSTGTGVTGDVDAGGLVGFSNGTINNVFSAVNVTGESRIGGLAGTIFSGVINNSYASGEVKDIVSYAGGLAGSMSSGASITNTFAVGKVSGSNTFGLVRNFGSGSSINSSYWDTDTSGTTSSSSGGIGQSTTNMKSQSTFSDWDFTNTWGIREGVTYPYLLGFKPSMKIGALPRTTYNLSAGQEQLQVTGTVLDGSVGEALTIDYEIRNSLGTVVSDHSLTSTVYANGTDEPIDRTIPLAGLPSGAYTLNVTAADTYNSAYMAAPLSFTIDQNAPDVQFSMNGSASPAQTASISVIATDAQSGIASLQYAWTQSMAVPASGWTTFSSGDTLTRASGDGNWYLHVHATDTAGNAANEVTNAFLLDNTHPSVTISSTVGSTVNAAFPITITFSEPVTGFTAGGIAASNGTLSSFAAVSATTYTATITPIASGQAVTVNIAAGTAADTAGNGNTVSNTLSFMYDSTKPVVTFGGFTDHQTFITPPTSVSVTVSEAVYWVADGAQLTSSNTLPLVSLEKDGVVFATYSPSYNASSRTFTLVFKSTLDDGVYTVKVAGNVVKNVRNNTLDAASASFTVAVPVITSMTANPTSYTGAGGSATVSITGVNLTGQTVGIYLDGTAAVMANVSSPSSALATVMLPPNATASDQMHTLTVYLNGVAVAGQSATVTVARVPSSSYRRGGSSPSVAMPGIDKNGISLDPATIDTAKPSVTLEVTPNQDGTAYVSIPASVLTSFESKNAAFFIEIKTPYGSCQVPVNLASLIPGIADLLTANNVSAEDISFKITLSDKSGDKDIQAAFAGGLPNGKVMGAIVDYQIDIMNIKTGATIGTANQFSKSLTRIIPMPNNLSGMPAQWGAFRYNETTKKFEFVAAKKVQIDGVWHVKINASSNSVYVVAENQVDFTDMSKHWGQPFVQLAGAKGLVAGISGGKYDPDKAVTRAEFTAMLVRVLGRATASSSTTPYEDVKPDTWYFGEVATAKEFGLLDIVNDNSFKPDQPLTREEMASMLSAVIALENLPTTKEFNSLGSYKDIESVNSAYLEDVRLMVKLNIMTGTSKDTFNPKGETTRVQAAVVFIRTLKALGMIDG